MSLEFVHGNQIRRGRVIMETHVVRVILLQHPAPTLIHFLVALSGATHAQSRIHVHVMACEVQADESLKDYAPTWKRACKEDQETSCGASIRHHVQYSAKFGRLMEISRG